MLRSSHFVFITKTDRKTTQINVYCCVFLRYSVYLILRPIRRVQAFCWFPIFFPIFQTLSLHVYFNGKLTTCYHVIMLAVVLILIPLDSNDFRSGWRNVNHN